MKRWSMLVMATVVMGLAVSLVTPADAGNGAPTGAHYSLNIIGVDNPKNSTLTDSERHTIFVALGSKKQDDLAVTTDIWLTAGPFQVCDGNGFDAAYNCAGTQIGRGLNGAVFQLPCNTAITTDFGCEEGTVSASYQVWARALGQPKGSAVITTCAYDDTGTRICSTENTLDVLSRGHGKQTFQNVTSALTTLQDVCFDAIGDGVTTLVCGDVSLFNSVMEDYVWQYDNKGLRLAQIRFYLNP
jgi:hypothetical protein